jgi:hypothetical protein
MPGQTLHDRAYTDPIKNCKAYLYLGTSLVFKFWAFEAMLLNSRRYRYKSNVTSVLPGLPQPKPDLSKILKIPHHFSWIQELSYNGTVVDEYPGSALPECKPLKIIDWT